MADFPPSGVKEDSKYHDETMADTIIRHEMEGGIEFSRPRTTRRPARVWTTGFSHLYTDQKLLVDAFYAAISYGALSFSYTIPSTEFGGTPETVRVKIQGPIKWNYQGIGPTRIWDCESITLREHF